METEEKLKLIEKIAKDSNKLAHNKVTDIQMLFDYWNIGAWKGTEEILIHEYIRR